jgi:pimeloyl-ACP methyl ester carboxylesterase
MFSPQGYLEACYLYGADPDTSSADLKKAIEALRRAAPALGSVFSTGYLYQLLAAIAWTSLPWLWLIRQPTLILAGDEDPVVPAINAQIMKALIPRSQLYLYKGGHMGLLTHCKELASVVERFLTVE